jgi:hypothetical protein
MINKTKLKINFCILLSKKTNNTKLQFVKIIIIHDFFLLILFTYSLNLLFFTVHINFAVINMFNSIIYKNIDHKFKKSIRDGTRTHNP